MATSEDQERKSRYDFVVPAFDLDRLRGACITVRVGGGLTEVAEGPEIKQTGQNEDSSQQESIECQEGTEGESNDKVQSAHPKSEIFTVHKNLICAASPFFRKALEGDWKEAQQQTVPLEHDEPEIFNMYLQWIYSGVICAGDEKWTVEARQAAILPLCKSYVLGDKLQDIDFKDAIIDVILDLNFLLTRKLRFIYDNTVESSKIRCLAKEQHIYLDDKKALELFSDSHEVMPAEYLLDVAMGRLELKLGKRISQLPWYSEGVGCRYHEHLDRKEPCYLKSHRVPGMIKRSI